LLYACIERPFDPDHLAALLELFPEPMKKRLASFRRWEDAHLSLVGKLLLLQALRNLSITGLALNDLVYNKHQRPHFESKVDFNISHSGNYVVCAVSPYSRVGIDLEQCNTKVPVDDLLRYFAPAERMMVQSSDDPVTSFYRLWTRKEAALKAYGTGITNALNQVICLEDSVRIAEACYIFQEVPVVPGYLCTVATSQRGVAFDIREYKF
jgi:4'-phosphopantetheinyl transferase